MTDKMTKEMRFEVRLTAKELWQFSMYHANAGAAGMFNLIFTAAALFLLVFRWGMLTAAYRLLMFGCVLIFTVLQPMLLYGKVRRQAKTPAIAEPMYLTFKEEGFLQEELQAAVLPRAAFLPLPVLLPAHRLSSR